jgi:hypothetical protein
VYNKTDQSGRGFSWPGAAGARAVRGGRLSMGLTR